MPVGSTVLPELVPASAPAVRTDWEVPFEGHFCRRLDRFDRAGLVQDVPDIGVVAVARTGAGAVTRVVVRGVTRVDVHLLFGEERMTPGDVLSAGTNLLAGTLEAVPGTGCRRCYAGPGPTVLRLRTFTASRRLYGCSPWSSPRPPTTTCRPAPTSSDSPRRLSTPRATSPSARRGSGRLQRGGVPGDGGFLAVHRETRLALAAGWVTEPTRRADARI